MGVEGDATGLMAAADNLSVLGGVWDSMETDRDMMVSLLSSWQGLWLWFWKTHNNI